jgi:hypothetical protein
MAPKIRNITADEFQRLFKAPEIASSGLTVSDAINLEKAFEQRRSNRLKERLAAVEVEKKVNEAEREQEAQKQLTQGVTGQGVRNIQDIEDNLSRLEETATESGVQLTDEDVVPQTIPTPSVLQDLPQVSDTLDVAAPREEQLGDLSSFDPIREQADEAIAKIEDQNNRIEGLVNLGQVKLALQERQKPIGEKVGTLIGLPADTTVDEFKLLKDAGLFDKPTGDGAESRFRRRMIERRRLEAAKIVGREQPIISEAISGVAQVGQLKEKFDVLVERGIIGQPGMAEFFKTAVKVGTAKALKGRGFPGIISNEDASSIKAYSDLANGFVSRIRGLVGEKGVLTNRDMARIEGLITSVLETPESATEKFDELESIINNAVIRKRAVVTQQITNIQSDDPITVPKEKLPSQAKSDLLEDRFDQLKDQGVPEEEIYEVLADEGFEVD